MPGRPVTSTLPIASLVSRDYAGRRVLGACVFSHWILDWVTHTPDMPLYPGGPRHGLGMWTSIPLTLAVELALFALGVWIYATTTRARDRRGSIGWWALVILLLGMYFGALFGPTPPDTDALIGAAFGAWLLLAFAWWIERHRAAA